MKINWKHPLTVLAILLIIVEVVTIMIMPEPPTEVQMKQEGAQLDLSYIPYMLTAISAAFVAFFTNLIAMIFLILRGTVREHLDAILLHFIAFILPIIYFADRM